MKAQQTQSTGERFAPLSQLSNTQLKEAIRAANRVDELSAMIKKAGESFKVNK